MSRTWQPNPWRVHRIAELIRDGHDTLPQVSMIVRVSTTEIERSLLWLVEHGYATRTRTASQVLACTGQIVTRWRYRYALARMPEEPSLAPRHDPSTAAVVAPEWSFDALERVLPIPLPPRGGRARVVAQMSGRDERE